MYLEGGTSNNSCWIDVKCKIESITNSSTWKLSSTEIGMAVGGAGCGEGEDMFNMRCLLHIQVEMTGRRLGIWIWSQRERCRWREKLGGHQQTVGMRLYEVTKGGDTKKRGPRTELWDTNRLEKTKNLRRRQRRGIQWRRKTKRMWSPGNQIKDMYQGGGHGQLAMLLISCTQWGLKIAIGFSR